MKILFYFSKKMKRRQTPIFSTVQEDRSQIPHYRKIAELAPETTVGALAPAPGLGYAPKVSFSPQTGVEKDYIVAVLAKKDISQLPPEIVGLSAESCDYGGILLGNSQDWGLVVHNDGAREGTILGLEENKMKTIFAVEDEELGWVGFQTAEEAGTGATQINCYENLAEFNDAKLEKVRQGALAKLTEAEKAALGLTEVKVAGSSSTRAAARTTTSEGQAVP
jgi:hypothetical protein